MNYGFLLRLMLDLLAATLLVAALAYYWLDNLAHELIGTSLFLLLIVHTIFNRRWYGRLFKGPHDARRRIAIAVNLSFLAVMLVLAVTSLTISRSLLSVFALDDDFTLRAIHKLAAYWAVAILGIHLGLNWHIVMNAVRHACGVTSRNAVRTILLRICSGAVAFFGVQSSFQMAFGSKLILHYTLDMWDFNEETPRFFLNYLSIVWLYATLTHFTMSMIRWRRDSSSRAALISDRA